MKRMMNKTVAVLLVAVMLMPMLCSGAFKAAAVTFVPEGRTVSIETAIYKEIDGAWTRVTRVNPGDAVKVRVFADTDFVAGNCEFILFYDEDFFLSSYPISYTNSIQFNQTPGFYTVEEGYSGTFSVKGATPKNTFPLYAGDVITSEFFDSHGYFAASVEFFGRKSTYDNSDWMCEFDLTVKDGATGTGDVFVLPDAGCNSTQTISSGLNFPIFDTEIDGSVGGWLWMQNYGFEPIYNISSTPVGVPGAAMSVIVSDDAKTIDSGKMVRLVAAVSPADATNKDVVWTSSDTAVATVDESGVVTGVSNGTAVITATTVDGGFTDTCTVTVNTPVSGISLDKTQMTLAPGAQQALEADIEPATANLTDLVWASSNTSVATVENGVVTAVSEGSAVITVRPEYNPAIVMVQCAVTVAYSVSGIEMNLTSSNLDAGKTLALSVEVSPANATNKQITWSSSNTAVAVVDANGVVAGIASGTAVITARSVDGSFTAQCSVTVVRRVDEISLSQTEITVRYKKDSPTLTASVVPSNADNTSITWSSENEKIARVDENGKVTARDMGTTYIVATSEDGTVTARCKVTVTMTFFQRIIRWFKILFGTWNTAMAALVK